MKNTIKTLFICMIAVITFSAIAEQPAQGKIRPMVAGEDYQVLSPKGTNKPEVIEFFSYACPHCYTMETFVNKFKKENPNIAYHPIPTDLGHSQWTIYVKAFYLGELLKVLDKSHAQLFHRLQVEKKPITGEQQLKDFFVALGVDPKEYDKANKSFALASKLRKGKQLARTFQMQGTPTFIANKRYKLDNAKLGSMPMIEKALKDLTQVK